MMKYGARKERKTMADQERTGEVTMRGNPLTLIGSALKPGDKAPDFQCVAQDLSPVTLASSAGKARLLISVPSLDTPVCSLETVRFNREVAGMGGNSQVYVISMDLPFAQKRFCGSENIGNVESISDHRDASFGRAYGVLIKELRLLARALFVVDARDTIRYVQLVREVTQEPNYDEALNALRAAAG
jgi:thioredoxin-dependent peroxiredoxin